MINNFVIGITNYNKLFEANMAIKYLLDSDTEERLISNLPTVVKVAIVLGVLALSAIAVMQTMKKNKK